MIHPAAQHQTWQTRIAIIVVFRIANAGILASRIANSGEQGILIFVLCWIANPAERGGG